MEHQRAVPSDLPDISIDSDIVIKSIGYQSTPIDGVPFDNRKKIIPHNFGCVVDPDQDNKEMIGLYVAGWAKRGPVGIIDATLRDTKQTFGILKHHLETQQLQPKSTSIEEIVDILPKSSVTYKNWLRVDEFERVEGEKKHKIRDKVLDRQ